MTYETDIDTASEMADWLHMLHILEQATPRFEAATDAAYQPLTFGWQVGGVLEKATGRSLVELMQQHLVEPLQLDHVYFGVPQDKLCEVARLIPKRKKAEIVDVTTQQNSQKIANIRKLYFK